MKKVPARLIKVTMDSETVERNNCLLKETNLNFLKAKQIPHYDSFII